MQETKKQAPKVSVVMAAYNAEKFLTNSVDSILNQTLADFELIIVNDGSTDKTQEIIDGYKDSRIMSFKQKNQGPVAARNNAIQKAKGKYIAIMDSDDIALPTRLEKEAVLLDANVNIGAVGSNYSGFSERGIDWTTSVFTHPDDLKACMVLCNQFGHASVMFRKSTLDQVGLYSSKSGGIVEDYDLLVRVSHVADLVNIEEPLLKWRKSAASITHSNLDLQINDTFKIRDREFKRLLSHRSEYRLFRFHPSGKNYFVRKSTFYRNYAYLYRMSGHALQAFLMMFFAIVCQPLNKRNYKRTGLLLRKAWVNKYWDYEFL